MLPFATKSEVKQMYLSLYKYGCTALKLLTCGVGQLRPRERNSVVLLSALYFVSALPKTNTAQKKKKKKKLNSLLLFF